MDEVRIGIIGVGNMGTNHARSLLRQEVDRCRLAAVCDLDPERFEKFRVPETADLGKLKVLSAEQLTSLKDVKTYTDSNELIRSGEVDAVIIATPHYDDRH